MRRHLPHRQERRGLGRQRRGDAERPHGLPRRRHRQRAQLDRVAGRAGQGGQGLRHRPGRGRPVHRQQRRPQPEAGPGREPHVLRQGRAVPEPADLPVGRQRPERLQRAAVRHRPAGRGDHHPAAPHPGQVPVHGGSAAGHLGLADHVQHPRPAAEQPGRARGAGLRDGRPGARPGPVRRAGQAGPGAGRVRGGLPRGQRPRLQGLRPGQGPGARQAARRAHRDDAGQPGGQRRRDAAGAAVDVGQGGHQGQQDQPAGAAAADRELHQPQLAGRRRLLRRVRPVARPRPVVLLRQPRPGLGGRRSLASVTMPPVAQTMKKDFPEVQDATRILSFGTPKIIYNNIVFKNDGFALVDPNFFSIFTFPMIKGDPKTALTQPDAIVLTQETAEKYFGKEDPIGKIIEINTDTNRVYKVTGVIENMPSSSHFHFNVLGSLTSWADAKSDTWLGGNYHTYLLLKPGTDLKKMEARFPDMVEKYMGPQIQQQMGVSLKAFVTKR